MADAILRIFAAAVDAGAACPTNAEVARQIGTDLRRASRAIGTLASDGRLSFEYRKGAERRATIAGKSSRWSVQRFGRTTPSTTSPLFGVDVVDQARRHLMSRGYVVLSAGAGAHRVDRQTLSDDELVEKANRSLSALGRPPLSGRLES
ncbi:hypothetical protein [Azospirillum agricola]|uniref:hypothetical protein n=1 Tax=Azospirillum agricola TaxID=1720247 RepID=UPI000A0EF4A2|nr:hypothetical protein [Azospirillum agricola]SMH62862.1 hypothetical protein SAMN02982994_6685 [Azospirillum lipoferum]